MTGTGASLHEEGPVGLVDNDIVLPFQIETQAARGKLVRLGGTVDRILSRRNYPGSGGNAAGRACGSGGAGLLGAEG